MPEPAVESSPEFVTVSEAARALQLSERQVRRYLPLLDPTDKRQDPKRQHKGQPVALVSLAALETLQKQGTAEEKPSGKPNGHSSGVPVEPSGTARGVPVAVAPVELLERLAEAEKRTAVLEAERDGLMARLADATKHQADTATDRDAWKAQAQDLTQALQRAQDEARAARLIGGRAAPALSALETSDGSQSSPSVSGGVIDRPEAVERPWWAFWRKG